MKTKISKRKLRLLHFDCEARPLSWYAGDFVSKEITAIAAGFTDQKRIYCWLLGQNTVKEILEEFVEMYNEADIVSGHYIRKFDLPLVNSALMEAGLPSLSGKLVSDTHSDLVKKHGVSNSQEALSAMLRLEYDKVQMTQEDWREANRLTTTGIGKTRKRVIGDVKQHMEMRQKLIELGMLKSPKIWNP